GVRTRLSRGDGRKSKMEEHNSSTIREEGDDEISQEKAGASRHEQGAPPADPAMPPIDTTLFTRNDDNKSTNGIASTKAPESMEVISTVKERFKDLSISTGNEHLTKTSDD